MSCATTVVGMFPGVYGHQLAMVVIVLGLWVTSQFMSRFAEVCGLRHKSCEDVRMFSMVMMLLSCLVPVGIEMNGKTII